MYENITNDKMVTKPNHYQSETGLEVIDVIEAFTFDLQGIEATDTGNVIKYICRWKKKNGLQDLQKTMWYLQHLIDHVKKLEEENDIPNNDSEKHSGRFPWGEANPWTKVETAFKDFNKTVIETLGEKKDIPSKDELLLKDIEFMLRSLAVKYGVRETKEAVYNFITNNNEKENK